jgi:PhoPQ-activated pathogenicity-related protein
VLFVSLITWNCVQGLKEALEREREARKFRKKRLIKKKSIHIDPSDDTIDIIYEEPEMDTHSESLTLEDVIAQSQIQPDVYTKM